MYTFANFKMFSGIMSLVYFVTVLPLFHLQIRRISQLSEAF